MIEETCRNKISVSSMFNIATEKKDMNIDIGKDPIFGMLAKKVLKKDRNID
eukprot:CAMPEP_0205802460 /NCGR_PEP_ID=MMETSP0205-20121125/4776_1 /ASSEMBLY_ACC=CAM_ASM_000278 /TAXON_ID=36767 /ORGANISM="Euplotes focardii, Strain TN1" /LENGTH=50 /DNA_ID=CAMNT_0053068885 /DNA_START=896 /DNA_END=1045 /DNA_ORIENTATION=-